MSPVLVNILTHLTVVIGISVAAAIAVARMHRQHDMAAPDETTERKPAGVVLRLTAAYVDISIIGLMLLVCAIVLYTVLDAYRLPSRTIGLTVAGGCLALFLAYYTLPALRGRQTWGKQWAGIAIETNDGGPPRSFVLLRRSICLLITLLTMPLLIGFSDLIALLVDKARRSIHDQLSDTQVRQVHPPSYFLSIAPLLGIGITLLLAYALLRPFFIQSFFIPSKSMSPTLQVDDKMIANMLAYRIAPIRQGDVVVFRDEKTAAVLADQGFTTVQAANSIKRVIALSGDTVRIVGGKGVYVNGMLLEEPYLDQPASYSWPEHSAPYRVPDGCCFLLGDNRDNSMDSHYWYDPSTGEPTPAVPLANIFARAGFIFFPPERWHAVR